MLAKSSQELSNSEKIVELFTRLSVQYMFLADLSDCLIFKIIRTYRTIEEPTTTYFYIFALYFRLVNLS